MPQVYKYFSSVDGDCITHHPRTRQRPSQRLGTVGVEVGAVAVDRKATGHQPGRTQTVSRRAAAELPSSMKRW